jgi:hypothetical protein
MPRNRLLQTFALPAGLQAVLVSSTGSGAGDGFNDASLQIATQQLNDSLSIVPEPETFFLLGVGLVCLALYLRLRKRARK